MGLFWRRKKEDEFVSLRLNEPPQKDAIPETPPPPEPPAKPEPPTKEVEPPVREAAPAPVPSRSPFRSSVLGLDRSIEELQAEEADRKSTRLNSCHGYISYAVFCLKKKKKRE